jgi:uncharacterized peroxidase-related enzyme
MTIKTGPLFTPLTIEAAPEASKPILEEIKRTVGFIPNLMAIFAHNPAVLNGYVALERAFEHGTFTPRDRQIILLATSVENKCNYCTAAHSTIAQAFLFTPVEIISAIVSGKEIPDRKIHALVTLVREVVRQRGYVSDSTIQDFLSVGYTRDQVMELLLGVAMKTISNYVDHISPVPLDRQYVAAAR